ncbi:hypothetical protein DZF91_21810 [Actinomadura logoneensis]|uniref:Uncharacterized protein n=1 Tax=Actinomadura logoneensis TaxID=2293572 RepID=A0A372JHP1_9ACTN|nr:hypothetical protein [Actinomadura logoneensis]RFU39531.1 hypothetical protein DZF91_21810 [Actinomadura logoneensis]
MANAWATSLWIDVGAEEVHRVGFSFDKRSGSLVITVDGVPVRHQVVMLSLRLTRRYVFPVGVRERHLVRIEKKRKLLLAALRPQEIRVFVDDRLVRTANV